MTTSVTRARLSQDRSRQRREALLDAAIELFAEGGLRAVTHRAVAKQAKVPAATTTYYFESIDDLISTALTRHIELWIADLRALTEESIDETVPFDNAEILIAGAFAARTPDIVRTQLAIFLAAASDQKLRPKAQEALQAVERLAASILRSVGIPDSDGLVQAVLQVIAGSAISRSTELYDDAEQADRLFQTLKRLVASWSLDDKQINDLLPHS